MPVPLRCPVDDIPTLLQLFKQLRQFLRRMLEVVIHRDDKRVLRGADSTQKSAVLPEVTPESDSANPGMLVCQRPDDAPALILATVVYQNELIILGTGT